MEGFSNKLQVCYYARWIVMDDKVFKEIFNEVNKPMKESIDDIYFVACNRAKKVFQSFAKDYGEEMAEMAFKNALGN